MVLSHGINLESFIALVLQLKLVIVLRFQFAEKLDNDLDVYIRQDPRLRTLEPGLMLFHAFANTTCSLSYLLTLGYMKDTKMFTCILGYPRIQ